MKLTAIRWATVFLIISVLCVGALFQYITAEQNTHSNAVLVMAQINE